MNSARRRDSAATRERILLTARRNFATVGYDRCTVRAIASDAGVSANLITRYFGGKHGLFLAATEVDMHIADTLAGPLSGLGARIAQHVVQRWEANPGDDPLVTMMRAAMSDQTAAGHLARFLDAQASGPLAEHLGPGGPERSAAVSALIMGVIVQRYILCSGPAARASSGSFTSWLGLCLQRLITAPSLRSLDEAAEPDGAPL